MKSYVFIDVIRNIYREKELRLRTLEFIKEVAYEGFLKLRALGAVGVSIEWSLSLKLWILTKEDTVFLKVSRVEEFCRYDVSS
jgi:hypothetical protein